MSSPKVLLAMSKQKQEELRSATSALEGRCVCVETCSEARDAMAEPSDLALVIVDETLPDSNWYSVLEELVNRDVNAKCLVVVPSGCETSVIKSHGVGVLEHPFDASTQDVVAEALRAASNVS